MYTRLKKYVLLPSSISPAHRGVTHYKSMRTPPSLRFILIVSLLTMVVSSCGYKHRKVLFKADKKPDTKGQVVYVENPQKRDTAWNGVHRIKVDDQLSIRFLNNFDLRSPNIFSEQMTREGGDLMYSVEKDSMTVLPLVGRVQLTGMTATEAARSLEKTYSQFVVNPIISVEIRSLSVNVMGQVANEGVYGIVDQKSTLIDVLAKAGGIGTYGKPHSVKIIRGDLSDPEIIIVDITKVESLKAPELILRDRDIIYVEPRGVKLFDTTVRPYTFLISVLTSAATVYIVLSRRN